MSDIVRKDTEWRVVGANGFVFPSEEGGRSVRPSDRELDEWNEDFAGNLVPFRRQKREVRRTAWTDED